VQLQLHVPTLIHTHITHSNAYVHTAITCQNSISPNPNTHTHTLHTQMYMCTLQSHVPTLMHTHYTHVRTAHIQLDTHKQNCKHRHGPVNCAGTPANTPRARLVTPTIFISEDVVLQVDMLHTGPPSGEKNWHFALDSILLGIPKGLQGPRFNQTQATWMWTSIIAYYFNIRSRYSGRTATLIQQSGKHLEIV